MNENTNLERSSKYGAQTGRPNPVQLAFEQELSRFVKYVTRKAELGAKWKKTEEEAFARGSNTLFNLWNGYESRLQQTYFIQKVISTGDFLLSIKEYKVAQYQCFGRYLRSVRPINTTLETSADSNLEKFKAVYFSNGLADRYTSIVLRALLGEAICSFHVKIAEDIKLKNPKTVVQSITYLKILRLITQTALHKETYCWLVFNGTVHIYTICRHLMALGHSKEVLEFLLWACMCMESSVPLMTVKYLSWRCTLYSAVCHCYYDLKALTQAEAFAKRAVSKVNELEDIEKISTSETTPMSVGTFREAKAKMQIMVFKRVVFETRKRPKGLLRPKTKPNLKDSINLPWPRTPAERLLTDLFQASTSAQFLAILESLTDSHRRTLHCEPPPVDTEDTMTDVYGELFFAGLEIIAGGGGMKHQHAMKHDADIHPSVVQLGNHSLVELVRDGARGVPLQSVVKFIKLAFNSEQWDTFNTLVHQTLDLLKNQENPVSLLDIKTLELMLALEPFYSNIKKPKKSPSHGAVDESIDHHTHQGKGSSTMDDLMFLADTLHSCSLEPFKSVIGHMDPNMVIDAALFLWSKCKIQFQRVVSASMEGCKFVLNDKEANKWVYLITVVHTALSWSDACTFDPILFAEVALKLSLVLECKANQNEQLTKAESQESPIPENRQEVLEKKKANPDAYDKQAERAQTSCSNSSKHSSVLGLSEEGYSRGVRGLLAKSIDVLYQAFEGIGRARDARIHLSSKDIVDVTWIKNIEDTLNGVVEQDGLVQCMIKALHMELLFVHHRVVVKLNELGPDPEMLQSQKKLKSKGSAGSISGYNDLISFCDKNPLSKALMVMHKASCTASLKGITGSEQQAQLMKESIELIQKAQQQDQKLLKCNKESKAVTDDTPPPPILLYRSPSIMVFKPAPFEPKNDQVAWYSLFARSANGNNIKVRLNDYQLPGTGEETPATSDCELIVKGLKPNQRYVFAVAAYNSKGQLIGKTIGSTSRSVLAAYSLPTLMAWGYLAQIAFSAGVPAISQQACAVLWNHFVIEPQPSEEELKIKNAENDLKVRLKVLDQSKIHSSSPVLVRQFVQSIFISVDLSIRDNFLYCNSLCDNGPLYNSQVARLRECERLLLAIQVAGWLNDAAMCLQAIVQVYGLLAPMVQQKIPAKPVVQVLLRCHAVLQEVPSLTRHRRQSSASDSLSHMIAAMTYFVAKILQSWEEKGLCGAIVELGKKMLNLETAPDSAGTMASMHQAAAIATANMVGQPPPKTKKKLKPKHKGLKAKGMDKDLNTIHDGHDEELKTLEAYMMKLSQKAILNREDDDLTGSEDPTILHSFVSSLPAQEAYKEVLKFKRRTRFLEFFVQVLGKAIDEGMTETCLHWTNDTMTWIIRRNEMLLANKPTIVRIGTTGVGQEDERIKRFATAIVEFGKVTAKQQATHQGEAKDAEPDEVRVRTKQETAKPPQSKNVNLKSSIMSRRTGKTKGKTEEEINLNLAVEKLQSVLPDYWRSCNRRKKLRSVNKEELPWKVQLNVLTAGCNLELFLERVGNLQCMTDDGGIAMYRSSYMDPDWFSFSTSGTFIVSWSGSTRRDSPEPPMGFSGSMMELPPYSSPAVTTAHTTANQPRVSQPTTETIRAGSRVTASDRESVPVPKSPLVYLGNVFSNLTRAIVLAHRGKYWTMMQNACRCLWNATNTIMIQVTSGSLRLTDDPQGETKSDIDILRGALWKPFYTAADCLMDMIVHLQDDMKHDVQLNKKYGKVKKGDPEISKVSGLMGGIEDQKGGSSLRFEIPLDNTNILDTRWVKQLILYAAEMMFYEAKWERVVDVSLRFNALTRSRYAESVLPMLIIAQRKLAERVEENGGLSKSQPVITISKETGAVEEFIITPAEYERIEPAVHIDPIGHNVYSSSTDALRLVSVPLDVNDSLNTFREALDTKHHTARALEHSRQLLLCYLAGQQKGGSTQRIVRRGSSRVGFAPTQIKPPSDVPSDLSEETFDSMEDIKTYTLQSSQLAVVISSYDKTIEMLQFQHQPGLAAQAMHELGNIMFHTGNIRMAYRWWAEALDSILKTSDAVKNWRDLTSDEDLSPSEMLLKRCGLWGCLLAAIVAAKIAQYVHTSNLGLRQECCLLSATLFKTLLCSTLPHPTADKDYALYEVGTGFEVKELIPGIDLLSDVFRSDGRSVVAALRWVTEELARAKHLLTVLPLITLCLYFTSHVCRDVQRTVDIRILRVRVLTDLGLFSQAITVLCGLLKGMRLPRVSMERQITDPKKKGQVTFCNSKHFNDANNVAVLNDLMESSLPDNLAQLYGGHITAQVNIAHAHLLIAMASKIYAIPQDVTDELERFFIEKAEAEAAEADYNESNTIPSTVLALGKKIGKTKKSEDTISVKSFTVVLERKLISTDTSPESLKSLLLCQAERIITGVLDSIKTLETEDLETQEEISCDYSPCDLELLVFAKLELSQISLERHHSVTAGMTVYSAMRAMEDAAVLNELDTEKRSPSMFNTSPLHSASPWPAFTDHYMTSQSRQRLDARLWLTCRLALAKSLAEEDSGMGKLGGLERSVTGQIGSCEHHCRQGFDEAEAFGDVEIGAEFAMLEFVYSLQHGKISDELIGNLEELILNLERCQTLSYQGQCLLTKAVIQYGDISKQGRHSDDLKHIIKPLLAYEQAASVVLRQIINLGECVDSTIKSPVLPLKNIFLQQLDLLVELKLRFGRAYAHGSLNKNGKDSESFSRGVKELELGISLMHNAAFKRKPMEARLVFSLGQVQRQMFDAGLLPAHTATNTLIESIRLIFSSDHDLGLMKQAYLEMAVTYLANNKQAKKADELLAAAEAQAAEQQKPGKTDKKESKQKTKRSKENKERLKEIEKEKRAAWAAIRAASLVSMAQNQFALMSGDPEISALKISEKSGQVVPDFALIDLLGTDDLVASDSNSLIGKNGIVTMATIVNDTNVVRITWIHLLGYLSLLRRQCSYKALGVDPVNEDGSYSLALSPLFCGKKAQKLAKVHEFLMSELDPYESDCCGVFPVEGLSLLSGVQMVVTQPTQMDLEPKPTADRDPVDKVKTVVNGFSTSSAKEFELSVYWGKLETNNSPSSQDRESSTLMLTYALNSKSFNMSSTFGAASLKAGVRSVPMELVQSLHEGLMSTLEIAESDLQTASQPNALAPKTSKSDLSVPGTQDSKSSPSGNTGRKKRTMGIRALSAKQRRDDTIRAKLKDHIQEISNILSVPDENIPQEVPFEVSLKNVAVLEALFDPSRGVTSKVTEAFFNWFSSMVPDC